MNRRQEQLWSVFLLLLATSCLPSWGLLRHWHRGGAIFVRYHTLPTTTLLPLSTNADQQQTENNLLDLESPFSYVNDDDNDDDLSPPLSGFYGRDPNSLENVTSQFLYNQQLYPLGKLTEEDVEAITGLMGAWTRQRSVEAALQIESLLKRLVDDLKAGNTDISIRTQHYVLLLDAWAKSNAPGAAERAQSIHDTMVKDYEETGNIIIRPSVLSCTILTNAWAKSNNTQAPFRADRVLQNMVATFRRGETYLKPDAVTFSTVMDSFSRSPAVSGPDACQRCEELFALMDELGVRKNVYTFSALQNAYARSGLPNALDRAMDILQTMQDLYEQGDIYAKPNGRNYNAVINAASRTGTLTSAKIARELLTKMETSKENGGYDVEPDRVSYTLTILACSRVPNRPVAAKMALSALRQMEKKAAEEERKRKEVSSVAPPVVRLDVESFNVVLTALSRSGAPDSEELMRKTLEKMHEYARNGKTLARPNTRSYNALLNFLARWGPRKNAGSQADEVLRSMFDMHKKGMCDVLPNAFSFAAVLTAYQRDATVAAVKAADKLLQEMEEMHESGTIDSPPDVYHYTILAGVWAKSEQGQKGADRSLEILSHMIERDNAGYPHVKPNCRTFNAVLDCLARADDGDRVEALLYHMLKCYKDGDDEAKPDSFSFNCAISAFTRSKKPGSGRRAEAILDRFLEYQENENPDALPDARSFTNIIAHYGRSRWLSGTGSTNLDSPYRAEYILNRMVNLFKEGQDYLEPNIFALTTVIDSYAYAKHPDSGTNAERLLRLVTSLQKDYGAQLAVTTTLLNSVLFAWSNSGDPNSGNQAAQHVDFMEREYANGNSDLQPDTRTYGLLLSAISKSNGNTKAQDALNVIDRMKEQMKTGNKAVRIHEHHYSLAINACAFSNTDMDSEQKAFEIATHLFDEVASSSVLEPSSLTYGWFIQACGRLHVAESVRRKYIEKAFHSCRNQGLVNDFVLKRLLGAASDEMLATLLSPVEIEEHPRKPGRIKVSMLPEEWTSRAHSKPKRSRGKPTTH